QVGDLEAVDAVETMRDEAVDDLAAGAVEPPRQPVGLGPVIAQVAETRPANIHIGAVARQHKAASILVVFVVALARGVPRADTSACEMKLTAQRLEPHKAFLLAAKLQPARCRRGDSQRGASLDAQIGREQPLAGRQLR